MIQKSRTHILKFLTPLKSSVEKTVNLHGFNFFYKPKNIKVVLSQCGSEQQASTSSPEVTVKSFKKYCISNAMVETGGMLCLMAVKRVEM